MPSFIQKHSKLFPSIITMFTHYHTQCIETFISIRQFIVRYAFEDLGVPTTTGDLFHGTGISANKSTVVHGCPSF